MKGDNRFKYKVPTCKKNSINSTINMSNCDIKMCCFNDLFIINFSWDVNKDLQEIKKGITH